MAPKHPMIAALRGAEISAAGRIFGRWEDQTSRATWCRAWVGDVALVVRTIEAADVAAFLRGAEGQAAATEACFTHLLNSGEIAGEMAELWRGLWSKDPTVTVDGAAVVFRRNLEIEQDGPPWPSGAEVVERGIS